MSVHLENSNKNYFDLSSGHWAVYLNLAQCFGWVPMGTLPPRDRSLPHEWAGNYDTNDGQIVCKEDALKLADHLNGAARHEKIEIALADVINHLEAIATNSGLTIPVEMKMKPGDFYQEFSPLLLFLYEGEFTIN